LSRRKRDKEKDSSRRRSRKSLKSTWVTFRKEEIGLAIGMVLWEVLKKKNGGTRFQINRGRIATGKLEIGST